MMMKKKVYNAMQVIVQMFQFDDDEVELSSELSKNEIILAELKLYSTLKILKRILKRSFLFFTFL